MPNPESQIPASHPAPLLLGAKPAFKPSVPEAEFLKAFPLPYKVQAVNIYDAQKQGWPTDRTYWRFLKPFRYLSPKWGPIEIPQNFPTDFASVPPKLHSIIDDDSPIILYPSAAHDFLFTKNAAGTRGWLPNGKQLTLTQVNHVLTEAMSLCGANKLTQSVVFAAVELANEHIRHEFAH